MPQKTLTIDVQHGLGNRLRALASAAAVAERTNRKLLVHWKPDLHCDCRFEDLYSTKLEQIDETENKRIQKRSTYYNYVDHFKTENTEDDILSDASTHIYACSQKVLKTSVILWDDENRFLRQLELRPEITEQIEKYIDIDSLIGLHIREEAGKDNCQNPYDDPQLWDDQGRKNMFKWRQRSKTEAFIDKVREILQEAPQQEFFVAADNENALRKIQDAFPGKTQNIPRSRFDRSRDQIQEAAVDLYLLSRCRYILGSHWSSFTELAIRLGCKKAYLAGIHWNQ